MLTTVRFGRVELGEIYPHGQSLREIKPVGELRRPDRGCLSMGRSSGAAPTFTPMAAYRVATDPRPPRRAPVCWLSGRKKSSRSQKSQTTATGSGTPTRPAFSRYRRRSEPCGCVRVVHLLLGAALSRARFSPLTSPRFEVRWPVEVGELAEVGVDGRVEAFGASGQCWPLVVSAAVSAALVAGGVEQPVGGGVADAVG